MWEMLSSNFSFAEDKNKLKLKPEKQLSLTDRLRLEFGLEDVDEGSKKKRSKHRFVVCRNFRSSQGERLIK